MKIKALTMLLPVMVWLAACDSQREKDEGDKDGDVNVRVEERRTQPERDTVFIGVENKEEEKKGVEIRIEEDNGDVDFEIKKK